MILINVKSMSCPNFHLIIFIFLLVFMVARDLYMFGSIESIVFLLKKIN